MRRPDLAKYLFLGSSVGLVFSYGVVVGSYQVFPFEILQFGKNSVEQVWRERASITRIRPEMHLDSARYDGSGVTRADTGRMTPGLTLISGFFIDKNELRLIKEDGTLVRRWPVRHSEIFPDSYEFQPRGLAPATDWNVDLHGAMALPDGSVVFNFEYNGLVKLDRCGGVEWTLPIRTHHFVESASDGGFWVGGRRYIEGATAFLPFVSPYDEDTVLKVSADGAVVAEISVPGILFKNELQSLLLANGNSDVTTRDDLEIVHLNDVEELTEGLEDRFPQFSAGDLLMSLRHLNLIMVVDPMTEVVKWHQTGPWIRQHDPDFLANGRISVFNNNVDDSGGKTFGGSNLIEIDPISGESLVKHQLVDGRSWYTAVRGRHQVLPNGNVLIVESLAGRVFEVTPEGEVVWEFINRYDEDEVARINDATRYAEGYFSVDEWACGN